MKEEYMEVKDVLMETNTILTGIEEQLVKFNRHIESIMRHGIP